MRILHLEPEIAHLTPGSHSNRAGGTVRGRRTVANCSLGANGFRPDTAALVPRLPHVHRISQYRHVPGDTHRLRLGYRWPQLLHSGGLTFPTDCEMDIVSLMQLVYTPTGLRQILRGFN
jgi:hypothetical protein